MSRDTCGSSVFRNFSSGLLYGSPANAPCLMEARMLRSPPKKRGCVEVTTERCVRENRSRVRRICSVSARCLGRRLCTRRSLECYFWPKMLFLRPGSYGIDAFSVSEITFNIFSQKNAALKSPRKKCRIFAPYVAGFAHAVPFGYWRTCE